MLVKEAIEILKERIDKPWDADDSMKEEYVFSTPIGKLINSYILSMDKPKLLETLSWLCLFVSRRALVCWELYCDGTEPREITEMILNWLKTKKNKELLLSYTKEINPSYNGFAIIDCRYCDTRCAFDSCVNSVKYITTENCLYAVYAISSADMAFDQSPLNKKDNFRDWLIEYAIPISLQQREMSLVEQNALRVFNYEEISKDRDQ
jgi:hypothetical protein